MTRGAQNDFMQGFRFHVVASTADGINPLLIVRKGEIEGGAEAGFQSVTLPEITVEAVEYREGNFKWTQKYPGPPTVSACTLMRGITKEDSTFHDWVMKSVDGDEYRCTVTIYQYQRTEMSQANLSEYSDELKRWECRNCVPTRAKAGADLDSATGEVSLAEVDFELESFDVYPKPA